MLGMQQHALDVMNTTQHIILNNDKQSPGHTNIWSLWNHSTDGEVCSVYIYSATSCDAESHTCGACGKWLRALASPQEATKLKAFLMVVLA
jgi:hypothetical protein